MTRDDEFDANDELDELDHELDSIASVQGDLYAFSDELLLVDEFSVLTIGGIQLGKPGVQPMIAVTLSGRYNRRDARKTVQIALEPEAMANLVRAIADSYGRARGPRGAFGEPGQ